ncbi:MAG TPA: N-acetyl-gamma-glutamyl-phosphate reductase [Terriglobales bacterium]|nr:N-acetyl-gamma-glutamyl-phosphate reductase [Terriglobales bacterium]
MLRSAIVGSTGYAGLELTRLLLRHPLVAPPLLLSREGQEGGELFSPVDGAMLPIRPFSWELLNQEGIELLFLATPHEVSRAWVPEALDRGLRVVDLSGAWRLRNRDYRAVYKFSDEGEAADSVLSRAVFGMPELHRDQIRDAQLVANPGCYPTSVILPLLPLLKDGLIDVERGIVSDAKSGVTGAGKKPTQGTHFAEVSENFRAYGVFTHRHTGEILEQLGLQPQQLTFSVHLLPIRRGILSSLYFHLRHAATDGDIERSLRKFHTGHCFVRIFSPPRQPEVQHVAYTNFCDIGWTLSPDRKRVMMVSCIDNLGKGAAGQAVQNMNIMYGWNETEGLIG